MALRNDGIVLLNQRINYFDGHPPPADELGWRADISRARRWHIVRHQPKQPTWAASGHSLGTVRHLIKYQLVATHKIIPCTVKITVWQCSARCYSDLQLQGLEDKKICWGCRRFAND